MKLKTVHLSILLTLLAIAVAAYAQHSHTFDKSDARAILLFGTAIALFAAALYFQRTSIPTRLEQDLPTQKIGRRPSVSLQIAVVAAALVTFLLSTDNEFNSDNVLAWVVSVAIFFYTFWEPQKNWSDWQEWLRARAGVVREFMVDGLRLSSRFVLFAAILLSAVFFYYYNLSGVPAEMDSDHAEKLLDVNDVVVRGMRPIFFERNTGREPMQFYLTAAFVWATQHRIDHMALKSITALMGVLVVVGSFFFVRELFDDDVAFAAAAFIAMSKWPITIARMGLRFPFTPVFVAPVAFFLFRALKRKSRNDFLMAGLFLGLGLLGYNAFRMMPVVVIVFIGLWVVTHKLDRVELSRLGTNAVLMAALSLVVFMPVFRYSVDHPDRFWYRALTRVSSAEQDVQGNPLEILGSNIWNAALMFNWTGDEAWPNTIPGDPALDYFSGGIFALGAAYALYRLTRHGEIEYGYVILGLGLMQLPSALALAFPHENPSIVRAGGAIPFVFILAALPIAWLARVTRQSVGRAAMLAVMVLLFALIARANFLRYFRDFDLSYRLSSWNTTEVADAIHDFSGSVDMEHVYIMLWPYWIDTRNVAINTGHIGWEQTIPTADDLAPMADEPSNKLIILNQSDENNLARLQEIFPSAQVRVYHSRTSNNHDFVVMFIPGTKIPGTPMSIQ